MAPNPIVEVASLAGVLLWDIGCTVVNLVTPNRKVGSVTPQGHPGADGKWPEYVPPKEGDSRCCCPALNAMANHGILPHDGKNITFEDMTRKVRATYNFAPTFCYFVPNYAANMLNKNYSKDTFDLADLDLHNGIEHDASLTRQDEAFTPYQGKPHIPFVKELLAEASGKDDAGKPLLTIQDLSRYSSKRRADARASNPKFTLDEIHKVFGSSNSSTLVTIFGGRIDDIESILLAERIPDGWESRIRRRLGLTITTFNFTVRKVENGISEEKYLADKKAAEQQEEETSGAAAEVSSVAK